MIQAFKVNSGRCGNCGKPAAYKQLLSGKDKGFLFCEKHANRAVVEAAERKAQEQAKQGTKK